MVATWGVYESVANCSLAQNIVKSLWQMRGENVEFRLAAVVQPVTISPT